MEPKIIKSKNTPEMINYRVSQRINTNTTKISLDSHFWQFVFFQDAYVIRPFCYFDHTSTGSVRATSCCDFQINSPLFHLDCGWGFGSCKQ